MKTLALILSALLLLTGCAPQPTPPEAPSTVQTEPRPAPGLYDPDHPLEAETGGAIRVFPLPGIGCIDLTAAGEDLIVPVSKNGAARLLRLSGENLTIQAEMPMDNSLFQVCRNFRISEQMLSYYDYLNAKTVCLDRDFQRIREIPDPEGLLGEPLLSADGSRLFYCTEGEVRVFTPADGTSRVLLTGRSQNTVLAGSLLEDTVLHMRVFDPSIGTSHRFLSARTGELILDVSADLLLDTHGSNYYASIPDGFVTSYVFGTAGEEPQVLLPRSREGTLHFLPQTHGAVSVTEEAEGFVTLEYYDLASGKRSGAIRFETDDYPRCFLALQGKVYFYLYDREESHEQLCCWEVARSPVKDGKLYTAPYHNAQNPDAENLQLCAQAAQALGDTLGIRILVWEDAAGQEPWDFRFQPEHRPDLTMEALEQLEAQLKKFPEGFFPTLSESYEGLTLLLVRDIRGSAESGSLEQAAGLQFWKGQQAYIALAVGPALEKTLYHELSHVIDTRVLGNSDVYDSWEKLNPRGFSYDYDYQKNQSRDGSAYLVPGQEAFVDTYSMSYPKEDRARILEYAMMPGNAQLFCSSILQRKLLTICTGIREAFGLEDWKEALPWEQYLLTSLAGN